MAETKGLRVTKVKHSYPEGHRQSAGSIHLEYEHRRENFCDKLALDSDEQAAPEFYDTLQALKLTACLLLELPAKDFENRIEPYGVTFRYNKEGTMSAIISVKLSLPDANTSVAINTPIRSCAAGEDAASQRLCFSEEVTKLLWDVERESREYIAGKRAQLSLFGNNGETNAEDDADAGEDGQIADNEQDSADGKPGEEQPAPEAMPPGGAEIIDLTGYMAG